MIPHAKVRSAMRKLWAWGDTHRAVKKRARIFRGGYLCELCGQVTSKPEVDHIEPVGPTPGSRLGQGASWDTFMRRLFCGPDGLQLLCEKCHSHKTRPQVKQGAGF